VAKKLRYTKMLSQSASMCRGQEKLIYNKIKRTGYACKRCLPPFDSQWVMCTG
jgi:hypothetical protein